MFLLGVCVVLRVGGTTARDQAPWTSYSDLRWGPEWLPTCHTQEPRGQGGKCETPPQL